MLPVVRVVSSHSPPVGHEMYHLLWDGYDAMDIITILKEIQDALCKP